MTAEQKDTVRDIARLLERIRLDMRKVKGIRGISLAPDGETRIDLDENESDAEYWAALGIWYGDGTIRFRKVIG